MSTSEPEPTVFAAWAAFRVGATGTPDFVLVVEKLLPAAVWAVRGGSALQIPLCSGEFGMDGRNFNRRLLVGGGVAAATSLTSLSLGSVEASSAEPALATAPAGGAVRHLRLYSEKLADGRMGYGLEKPSRTARCRGTSRTT